MEQKNEILSRDVVNAGRDTVNTGILALLCRTEPLYNDTKLGCPILLRNGTTTQARDARYRDHVSEGTKNEIKFQFMITFLLKDSSSGKVRLRCSNSFLIL